MIEAQERSFPGAGRGCLCCGRWWVLNAVVRLHGVDDCSMARGWDECRQGSSRLPRYGRLLASDWNLYCSVHS